MKINFEKMSTKELATYVLKHRNDLDVKMEKPLYLCQFPFLSEAIAYIFARNAIQQKFKETGVETNL